MVWVHNVNDTDSSEHTEREKKKEKRAKLRLFVSFCSLTVLHSATPLSSLFAFAKSQNDIEVHTHRYGHTHTLFFRTNLNLMKNRAGGMRQRTGRKRLRPGRRAEMTCCLGRKSTGAFRGDQPHPASAGG